MSSERISAANRALRSASAVCAGIALLLFTATVSAQLVTGGLAKGGFKFPDYDRASNLLKSLLMGRTARLEKDSTIYITDLRVETYAYPQPARKELELTVEAPTCNLDMQRKLASSPGLVRIRRADGQFTIVGEGFLLQQGEGVFTISNKVHAVLRPANPETYLQKQKP